MLITDTFSRSALRDTFIKNCHWHDAHIEPLKQDASARRYFRLRRGEKTIMLMDAPPPMESTQPFIQITEHLLALGLRVPMIYERDTQNGFLLLEDLGNNTFTQLLHAGEDEKMLFHKAIDALVQLQSHPNANQIELGHYDFRATFDEVRLFTDWYLPYLRKQPSHEVLANTDMMAQFETVWQTLFSNLPKLPETIVLRDFHVDNLMLENGQCALLDYQDARHGSPVYDLVSLLEDARRDVDSNTYHSMLNHYIDTMPYARQTVMAHLHFWGVQRHFKVAGIFARLYLRDQKPQYLSHLPRVIRLLASHLDTQMCAPLRHWTDRYFPELPHLHAS